MPAMQGVPPSTPLPSRKGGTGAREAREEWVGAEGLAPRNFMGSPLSNQDQSSPRMAMMQSPNGMPQSPEGLVQSAEGMIQSPEGMIQSPEGMAQSPEGLVQSPEGMLQSPEGIVQSLGATGMVQSPDGMVQSPAGLFQSPQASRYVCGGGRGDKEGGKGKEGTQKVCMEGGQGEVRGRRNNQTRTGGSKGEIGLGNKGDG